MEKASNELLIDTIGSCISLGNIENRPYIMNCYTQYSCIDPVNTIRTDGYASSEMAMEILEIMLLNMSFLDFLMA